MSEHRKRQTLLNLPSDDSLSEIYARSTGKSFVNTISLVDPPEERILVLENEMEALKIRRNGFSRVAALIDPTAGITEGQDYESREAVAVAGASNGVGENPSGQAANFSAIEPRDPPNAISNYSTYDNDDCDILSSAIALIDPTAEVPSRKKLSNTTVNNNNDINDNEYDNNFCHIRNNCAKSNFIHKEINGTDDKNGPCNTTEAVTTRTSTCGYDNALQTAIAILDPEADYPTPTSAAVPKGTGEGYFNRARRSNDIAIIAPKADYPTPTSAAVPQEVDVVYRDRASTSIDKRTKTNSFVSTARLDEKKMIKKADTTADENTLLSRVIAIIDPTAPLPSNDQKRTYVEPIIMHDYEIGNLDVPDNVESNPIAYTSKTKPRTDSSIYNSNSNDNSQTFRQSKKNPNAELALATHEPMDDFLDTVDAWAYNISSC